MVPEIHRVTFFKGAFALAGLAHTFVSKCWRLFRARPLLPIDLILLWGGLLVALKVKTLAVPGQIVWVTGFILWIIGMRHPKAK